MSAPAVTTETAWAAAIVSALQTQFAAVADPIGAYRLDDGELPQLTGQRAMLLRAGDAELPEKNTDLARQQVRIEWTVSVAVPTDTDGADLEALTLARRVAGLVRAKRSANPNRGNQWGLGAAVGDPERPLLPEWDDVYIHGYILRPCRWWQIGYFALEG